MRLRIGRPVSAVSKGLVALLVLLCVGFLISLMAIPLAALIFLFNDTGGLPPAGEVAAMLATIPFFLLAIAAVVLAVHRESRGKTFLALGLTGALAIYLTLTPASRGGFDFFIELFRQSF